jgi:predicted nucleic acid-binding protein
MRARCASVADLLVDTDVFVDHLRAHRELPVEAGDRVHYSSITRAELFAGAADQEDAVRELLSPFTEFAVDRRTAEAAGRIRRNSPVGLPDALIAATALTAGLELLTRNTRDFAQIEGVRLREP